MEEKKRRGGKFNIVDIIIVVIILAAVAFLGMKLLGNDGEVIGPAARIRYTVLVPEVKSEVCENILTCQEEKGQVQLMANGAMVDGYVIDISAKPHISQEICPAGEVVNVETPDFDMYFTLEGAVDSLVTKKVGTQEVRVGKSHIVKTVEYELEGYKAVITDLEVLE